MAEKKHIVMLDGLRGVAAVAVVFYHFSVPLNLPLAPHAYLAVDFFFALSGYVVALAYERKLQDGLGLGRFAFIRVKRLWPMLALGVAMGAAGLVLKSRSLGIHADARQMLVAMLCALAFLPFALPSLAKGSFPLNPPQWSLFYEMVANLVYALAAPRLQTWMLWVVGAASGLALAMLASRFPDISAGGDLHDWTIATARVSFSFTAGLLLQRCRPRWRIPAPLIVVLLIAVLTCPIKAHAWLFDLISITLVFPVLVGAAANAESPWPNGAQLIGDVSYPMYATHYAFVPVFSHLIRSLNMSPPAQAAFVCVETLGAAGFACLAWRFFDAPVRRRLGRSTNTTRPRLSRLLGLGSSVH